MCVYDVLNVGYNVMYSMHNIYIHEHVCMYIIIYIYIYIYIINIFFFYNNKL